MLPNRARLPLWFLTDLLPRGTLEMLMSSEQQSSEHVRSGTWLSATEIGELSLQVSNHMDHVVPLVGQYTLFYRRVGERSLHLAAPIRRWRRRYSTCTLG